MITEKELIFQAHSMLFNVADGALQTFKVIERNDPLTCDYVKLHPNDLLLFVLDYSISALEAFINLIGFIFDDCWIDYEKKNFWDQYQRVMEVLIKFNLDITHLVNFPYSQFSSHRSIRNAIHHPHASKGNRIIASDRSIMSREERNKETWSLLTAQPHINKNEAEQAYQEVKDFIEELCSQFKKIPLNKLGNLDGHRQSILKRLKDFSFGYARHFVVY